MKYQEIVVKELLCDWCEAPLGNLDGWPYWSKGDNNYCPDCALKLGIIDAKTWLLETHGMLYDHASYKDGVITASYKWGRGYHVDKFQIFDESGKRIERKASL